MSNRHRLVLALLVSFAGVRLVAEQAAPAAQAGALPDARTVVNRFVAALGGGDAQRKLMSIHARGTLEVAEQHIAGQVEVLASRPNHLIERGEITGIGHFENGYNGTIAWSIDPISGPMLITGKQLIETKDDADFDAALHLPDHLKEMTTVGRAEFEGHHTIKLHVVMAGGTEQFEYYDETTGLQVGTDGTRESPMGAVPTTNIISDYAKFGPFMQPTKLVQRAMMSEQVIHMTSYEYDTVPANAFDPPPQIKALIKK